MSTKIEWCDETHNVVAGCAKVSPGCDHCYAERMAVRHSANKTLPPETYCAYAAVIRDGHWSGRVVPIPNAVERLAAKCASWRKPRRIFVQSMGDLFHDQVPFELVDQVLDVAAEYPRHTFQFLTKRPGNMLEHFNSLWTNPLPNVWGGVTVEDQPWADERIHKLLDTRLAVRFVSVEPMLREVSFRWADWSPTRNIRPGTENHLDGLRCLSWVICGGETGPEARAMDPEWARSLRDQCQSAGVPFFFKNMGQGRETPDDLDVREFPSGRAVILF